MKKHGFARVLVTTLAGIGMVWAVSGPGSALPSSGVGKKPFAYPAGSHPLGQSQAEWSADWWTWFMELPVQDHPGTDTDHFDVTAGQTGEVWFLAAPFVDGPSSSATRTCTIPNGKLLFLPLVAGEWSSLEGSPTEAEQRDIAVWQADHIVPGSLFCSLDGSALINPGAYRTQSPQFGFDAPTPWIFGDTGGLGTSVGDGYYVFLKELGEGHHTLRYGGLIHFTLADDGFDFDGWINMTYEITQLGDDDDED